MNKNKNILLKGAFNYYNFGDDLLYISILEFLNKKLKFKEISLFINKSDDSISKLGYQSNYNVNKSYEIKDVLRDIKLKLENYHIPNIAIKLIILLMGVFLFANILIYRLTDKYIFFKKYFTFSKSIDVVYFIGGGYLADKWKTRLYYEFFNLMCLKITNPKIKVIGTGLGLGPFDSKFSKMILRKFIGYFEYIYVRENRSFDLLKKLNFKGNFEMLGDDVFLLLPFLQKIKLEKSEEIVGVNIKDFEDHNYGNMIEIFSTFFNYCIKNGYKVEFYSFGQYPGPKDNEIITDLLSNMNFTAEILNPYDIGYRTFLKRMSSISFGIGFAYHYNVILSLINKNLYSIYSGKYYKQKIEGVMVYLNPDSKVMSVNQFAEYSNKILNVKLGAKEINNANNLNKLYTNMAQKYSAMFNSILS